MSPMQPFRELMDFERAREIIADNTKPVDRTEEIDIRNAGGRVLAETIEAGINVPGFRRAAMDGYAVIASDTYGSERTDPNVLTLVGRIFPGDRPEMKIEPGSCAQIATGAPMPVGADAVVIVEETADDGENISIQKPVYPGSSVSEPDSDIGRGDPVLEGDSVLTPPKIGVLAALGFRNIEVYSRPRVSVFPTGDEVVPPGSELRYGQIYDINSNTLAALLGKAGAEVKVGEIVGDTEVNLRNCIDAGAGRDYVLFSGGSSVGERDLIAKVVAEKGEILFHGIALKPGKPTILGLVGDTMVFGMPGYPTSCLTNAYVLLAPSVRKMARLPWEPTAVKARLSRKIVSTVGRHQIYTVKLDGDKAEPVFKESGSITSMSLASGYIEIPANTEFVEEGAEVTVSLF